MKNHPMLASLSGIALAAPYANAHSNWKLYVCATTQANDLNQAAFEGLTWVEVSNVGSHGETGDITNVLTYDTWGEQVVQKAKGMTNAGDPEVEVARDADDAGQIIMRTAGRSNLNYAFKMTANDVPNDDVDSEPTTIYNRGLVLGPRRPHGRNEDFDLEVFTLAFQQREIVVAPIDGTLP